MVRITADGGRRHAARATATPRDGIMMLLGAGLMFVVMIMWQGDDPAATSRSSSSSISIPEANERDAGWNPIHVFFGRHDLLTDPIPADKYYLPAAGKHGKAWFSQHGQDMAVIKALNSTMHGYFVDLASNDAVWASNTFALESNFGWKGICIEPNSFYHDRLSFRKCHAVAAVVGGNDFDRVQVTFSATKAVGPFGGIVGTDFDNKVNKDAQTRYTVSLLSILRKFNAPRVIDYLSLDVEGAEHFIMKDFDFTAYQFKIMTVERPKDELVSLFERHGYVKIFDMKRGDTLWAHSSVAADAKARLAHKTDKLHVDALSAT